MFALPPLRIIMISLNRLLNKLARMPRFLSIYVRLIRIINCLVFIIFLPVAFIVTLALALTNPFFQKNSKVYLTEETAEQRIRNWIAENKSKFKTIEETLPDKNYNLQINLIPFNANTLPISFAIGGQLLLAINIGEFCVWYDDDFLETTTLDEILEKYKSGEYYLLQESLDGKPLQTTFNMQLKSLSGKSDCTHVHGANEVTAIELRVAQKKILNFESL